MNGFKARQLDTITPPSITALRGKRESNQRIRDVGQTAGSTASSLRERLEKGMTERTEERQTAGHRSN